MRAKDLIEHGIPRVMLTRLVRAGKLERVSRGLYNIPDQSINENRSLAEVAIRVPSAIVCLLSALRLHGVGTQAPFEVWIAIHDHRAAPRLDRPALRVIRMSGNALSEGIETFIVDNVNIKVFSLAKTITDCFKFRNKIGLDVALEALRDAWNQHKVTMDELWHYATIDRVTNVMRPYLEALTTL